MKLNLSLGGGGWWDGGGGCPTTSIYLELRRITRKSHLGLAKAGHNSRVVLCSSDLQFSFQIFNAARQLSHIEAAPDKSGLVLLDYWVGLKRCLVIIHN